MPKKNVNFNFPFQVNFQEETKKGSFTGLLVNYKATKLAHGYYKFIFGCLEKSKGKKLHMLFQHESDVIPIGIMTGEETEEGFYVKGEFNLNTLPNGNPVNPQAYALYSHIKDMGAEMQMSIGGNIVSGIEKKENEKYFFEITEFEAIEGSIVLKAAVEGSKVETVFGQNPAPTNFEEENKKMDKELLELIAKQFKDLEEKMFKSGTEKEIKQFKDEFEKFEKEFMQKDEAIRKEFGEKFETLNKIVLSLKENYSTENKEKFSEIEEIYGLFSEAKNAGIGAGVTIETGKDFSFSEKTKQNFSATTTGVPDSIKPTYVTKILERLQAANPVLAELDFMSIMDNSLKISREELGLPSTGIVGETDTREETTTVTLDDVTVELYQWYVMPVVSNRLLAVNYVGYLPFLLMRAEYALSLNMANKLLNGSGTNQPLGILNDANITNTKKIDLTASTGTELDDGEFAKKIGNIFYAVRDEISSKAKWYMRRGTWEYITNLQNADKMFYVGDLAKTADRILKNRPVIIVEDDNSGLKEISSASNGDNIILFGDIKNGVQGAVNNKMDIRVTENITSKGFTKYWIEKGAGFGVKLPENFVKVTLKK